MSKDANSMTGHFKEIGYLPGQKPDERPAGHPDNTIYLGHAQISQSVIPLLGCKICPAEIRPPPWIGLGKNVLRDLWVESTNQGSKDIQGYFDKEYCHYQPPRCHPKSSPKSPNWFTESREIPRRGASRLRALSFFHPVTPENPRPDLPAFFPAPSRRTSP